MITLVTLAKELAKLHLFNLFKPIFQKKSFFWAGWTPSSGRPHPGQIGVQKTRDPIKETVFQPTTNNVAGVVVDDDHVNEKDNTNTTTNRIKTPTPPPTV